MNMNGAPVLVALQMPVKACHVALLLGIPASNRICGVKKICE